MKGTPGSQAPSNDDRLLVPGPSRRGRLGWIVACSLLAGIVAAALLAFAPFIPATESGVSGAILLGLALGWAMLVVLAMKFTDQPQSWAAAPAIVLGLGGFLLVAFGTPLRVVLAWLLPPVLVVLAAWMIVQAHRHLRSVGGRILLYPVIAVLALVSVGAGYEKVHEVARAQEQPAQGQLIDVGGHRLYLNCTGEGSPTVVLEPGAGQVSSDLARITPFVAQRTRVCVYDRAGRGWSEPARTPQDGAHVAADLHTLLQRGDERGPYVLAGHSFGGLYALTFAAHYPQDVAGLVLIDSTAPASDPTTSAHPTTSGSDDTLNRISALVAGASRLGISGLLGVAPEHLQSTVNEYLLGGPSMQQAANLSTFDDKPLIVLTAGSGSSPGWASSQEALASLSTNSVHRVINGTTHESMTGSPPGADATSRGILDVVSAVQSGSPLND